MLRSEEEPIFRSEFERAHGILGEVVIDLKMTVKQQLETSKYIIKTITNEKLRCRLGSFIIMAFKVQSISKSAL